MRKKETFDKAQGHGDHFDSICYDGDQERILKMLPEMLEKAKLIIAPGKEINCSLGKEYPKKIAFAMLSDTTDSLHLNMLIGCNINGERNELLSFYPEMTGFELPVKLTEIHEWGNGVEATLEGEICNGEHHIAFFDTRYVSHKGKYEIGKSYKFRLSAFAAECEILEERTFKMEGQEAADFRKKIGEEPEHDENGKIKPVEFDMSQAVAFFQHSVAYPHVAEFQSPASGISVLKKWEREYYSINITIAHDEDDDGVCIPLIAKKTFFKTSLKEEDPIRGIIFLQGYLSESDFDSRLSKAIKNHEQTPTRKLPRNLYVLRWNPAISSFKEKEFDAGFPVLQNGDSPSMDWSIREPEQVKPGDWWVLVRVGGNADGIVGIGRFLSEPESGESWRNDGKTVFYSDIGIQMFQKPEKSGLLKAEDLEKVCPEIDWHKGHSGVLIPQEITERLARYIAEAIVSRKGEFATPDFSVNQADGAEFSLVCGLLSQLCPQLLAELKKSSKATIATEMDRIPDYLDEIAYDEISTNAGKKLFESLRLLSWEGLIPIDGLDNQE